MITRGVKSGWLGRLLGYSEERVCLCKCHDPCFCNGSHVRHCRPCCQEPRTVLGKQLLEDYNNDNSR